MKTITLKQLKDLKACNKQVILFEQLFGEQVEITVEVCVAVACDFSWNWAVEFLLSYENKKQFEENIIPDRRIFDKSFNTRKCEYIVSHQKTSDKKIDHNQKVIKTFNPFPIVIIFDEYVTYWKPYQEAKASLFAHLYLTQ